MPNTRSRCPMAILGSLRILRAGHVCGTRRPAAQPGCESDTHGPSISPATSFVNPLTTTASTFGMVISDEGCICAPGGNKMVLAPLTHLSSTGEVAEIILSMDRTAMLGFSDSYHSPVREDRQLLCPCGECMGLPVIWLMWTLCFALLSRQPCVPLLAEDKTGSSSSILSRC